MPRGVTRPSRHWILRRFPRIGAPRPRSSTAGPSRGSATGGARSSASRRTGRPSTSRRALLSRPGADAAPAPRALAATGGRLGFYRDAPAELAAVALAHLGAGRRVELV